MSSIAAFPYKMGKHPNEFFNVCKATSIRGGTSKFKGHKWRHRARIRVMPAGNVPLQRCKPSERNVSRNRF